MLFWHREKMESAKDLLSSFWMTLTMKLMCGPGEGNQFIVMANTVAPSHLQVMRTLSREWRVWDLWQTQTAKEIKSYTKLCMNLSLTNPPNMRSPLLGRSFPLRSTCTLNLQCIRMGNQFSFLHLKDKYMFMYSYGPWYYCIQSNNFAQIYSRNFYLSLYHTEVF